MQVELDNAEEVKKCKVSSAGQVYVGNDYEGEEVRVAWELLDE